MSLPTKYNLLESFPNRYFVETGSYRGDAIKEALDAGFEYVVSCDINSDNIDFCIDRFDLAKRPNDKIKLFVTDSALKLRQMINWIDEPITFWLDSHWQLFIDEPKGDNPFPLLMELQQIAEHPIKEHTILIDDILYMTHPSITGWSLKRIKDAVKAINPAYKFTLIPNPVVDNLLICKI